MTRKARWTLILFVPLLIVAKARVLVWAVGLAWTPEHANGTLALATISGVIGLLTGAMMDESEKRQ